MLDVQDLEKSFGPVRAVQSASFALPRGQVLSLLGPSGCGKTTTLRMIAGFEQPTGGRIVLGGRDLSGVPARKRNIGMVFQSYALFPHMTAAENVAFGLEMRRISSSEREARVRRMLEIVHMGDLSSRMPRKLSGGQQQRVALARALVIEPDLLLLDEPLSALDLKLREEMRDEIHRIVRELGITTVFVTHDQGEALVLSDLIAVMNEGSIDQLGSPQEVFRRPATRFVADFIGGANVLAGQARDGLFESELGLSIPLPTGAGSKVIALAVRPEDIEISTAGGGLRAVVRRGRFLGSLIEYTVETASGHRLTVRSSGRLELPQGTEVSLAIDPRHVSPLSK